MRFDKKISLFFVFYLASVLLSFSSPFIMYVFAVLALALLLNEKHSFVRRLILSWLTYFSVLIASYIIFGALKFTVPFEVFVLLMPFLPLYLMIIHKRMPRMGTFASGMDVASAVVAISTFMLLCYPVFSNSRQTFLLFLTSGEDNASHIAIHNYNIKHQRFSYFEPSNHTGLIKDLSIYQQGMHINQAFIKHLLPERGVMSILYSFYIQGIFYYSVMVFMMCYLSLNLAQRLGRKSKDILPVFYGLIPLIVFLFGFGIFLHLLGWGFYTQVTSYTLLLIAIYLLDFHRQHKWSKESYILILLCVATISNVWFFLLPVAVMALSPLIQDWKMVWRSRLAATLTVVIGLVTITPVLINLFMSTKSNPLNEPGGVYIMSSASIVVSLLLTLVVGLYARNRRSPSLTILGWSLWAATLFVAAVWSYQRLTVGKNEYYFYKSVYALFLFLFIILSGISLAWISSRLTKLRNITILSGVSAGLLILGIYALKPIYPRVFLNNWFNAVLDINDIEVIEQAARTGKRDVVFIGDCTVASDYIANRWTGALLLSDNTLRSKFMTNRIYNRADEEVVSLANYLKRSGDITVRATRACLDPAAQHAIKELDNPVLYE